MIDIIVKSEAAQALCNRLVALGRDTTPLTRVFAGILMDASQRAFERQADPVTGEKWAGLSPVTVKRRGSSTPILRVSGQLASAVQSEHGPDFARLTVAKAYAGTMFFGAKRGQFGSTSRGAPIPWGDIPARRFMGLGPEDENEIGVEGSRALQRILGGA